MDSERSLSRKPRRSSKTRLWPSVPRKRKRGKKCKDNTHPVRQKNILRKLNPPPKPEPVDEPEPEVKRAPSLSQSIEVTGPRSCRLQKCAFRSCPNSAPSAAQHNHGVTYFAFPRNPGQDSKWARRVSRANGEAFWPRLTSRVCQLHFPPELVTADGRGVAALQRGAVPSAEPYRKEETPNIEEVLLPNGDIKEQVGSLNYSEDLVMKLEIGDKNPEVKQAVASLVDIPPPENGIKLQCVNVENKNATVHYLSVDKDNTVNHTHVNINKNNIATLHYVDSKNTVNHTLKCSNLNEDQISSYEALVNPSITQTQVIKTEIGPNQNHQENGFGIKINPKLLQATDEEIDETIQDTESDNLDTDIRVKSEDCSSYRETMHNSLSDNLDTDITVKSEECNSNGETEETIIGEVDTSAGIETCDDDFDETVVVKMEYESDSDNGLEPET